MAEALLREILGADADWQLDSAGTYAAPGQPATGLAQAVLAEIGIDHSEHRSQPVTAELLGEYALVLVMEPRHRELINENFPGHEDRIYLLTEMLGKSRQIDDPFGSNPETYRYLREELQQILNASLDRIKELAAAEV